jgi:uncharacterized RDD family membrane protein YckC
MEGPRPAGFWIRAVAAAVDFTIFALVHASFRAVAHRWAAVDDAWPVEPAVGAFTLLFTLAYSTVLHAVAGQTIGKLAVGVRVVGVHGELPGLGAAFLRYVSYYVSAATFGLGFLMAGLRRDKRALHDLVAGTRVEREPVTRAQPVASEPPAVPAGETPLAPPAG